MNSPALTIIIVLYNSASLLEECVLPFKRMCLSGFAELIVVDNDSSDCPLHALNQMGIAFKYLPCNNNEGFATAVNVGAREAAGEYILLLNPDVQATESVIYSMVERMQSVETIGAAGPILETDGVAAANGGRQPTLFHMIMHSFGLAYMFRGVHCSLGHYVYSDCIDAPEFDVEWVSGGLLLLRRSCLGDEPLLSERWFMYAEDLDLCRWILGRGMRVVLFGDLRARHAIGGSSGTDLNSAPRTMWISHLADYYQAAFSPSFITFLTWRLSVMLGYRLRALSAFLRGDKERSRYMNAYAKASFRAEHSAVSSIRHELLPKSRRSYERRP